MNRAIGIALLVINVLAAVALVNWGTFHFFDYNILYELLGDEGILINLAMGIVSALGLAVLAEGAYAAIVTQ